ncbi:hypothetical protein AAF712_015837 [Marasmius tenuissimus]|uniref:BZIP domain-containing protein n=1 Tax=Marasmius tenuissimus TaxID=585030 RepID=A0ABR2Z776_9AGAR
MPRLKLYHTKSERREANRIKNKQFYNKHQKEILYSKQVKHDEENKAVYREEVIACKQRKYERQKQKGKGAILVEATGTKESVSTMSERLALCLNELESKLDVMKAEH